jgi:DNA-binding GntR family transcriptional regulator
MLRDAILAGEVPPGSRLRQDDIAVRYGASRLPVREALRILEAEGLVELIPHRGGRVPVLEIHEVDVFYKMRERLEPLTLAESIPYLTDAQIGRLAGIQEAIERTQDVSEFLSLDRDLHIGSYEGCRSRQLLDATLRLWNSTQHYRRAFMVVTGRQRMDVVNAEHRLLLDAILRRDTQDAERFLSGHIRRTRVELTRHPELFDSA